MAYNNNTKSCYQSRALLLLPFPATLLLLLLSPSLVHAFSIIPSSKPLTILNNDRLYLSGAYNTNNHPNPNKNKKEHTTTRRLSLSLTMSSVGAENGYEESFPNDPASTTTQLLESLWALIVKGCGMTRGESITVNFPLMESTLTTTPHYLENIMTHLDQCKDVCDDFGTNTILSPHIIQSNGVNTVTGFTVESFRSDGIGTLSSDGEMQFAYDPMFDDENWDMVESTVQAKLDLEVLSDRVDSQVPADANEIADSTRNWCQRMSNVGINPFLTEIDKSTGLPIGPVYSPTTTDRCSMPEMYHSYWQEVARIENTAESQLSTTLLMAPNFASNSELFEGFYTTLKDSLELLELEKQIQLCFFHPEWDLQTDIEGVSAATSDSLRPPWPMINIVRTNQVRIDQLGKSTEIYLKKEVAPEDFQSVTQQTEGGGGNMMTIVVQALEKRLTGGDGRGAVLSGMETSAVLMASDLLLGHIDQLMYGGSEEEMSAGV